MTTSTDGSSESEKSGQDSKGNVKHSQSTTPVSEVLKSLPQRSWTKKVAGLIALLVAVKFGAILVFGDNAYITLLMDLLINQVTGAASN